MMRIEFAKAVKVAIIRRATHVREDGYTYGTFCEECGEPAKQFEIDHITAEGLRVSDNRRLGPADGQLLCLACHRQKTASDKSHISKAKRVEARHVGADPPKGNIRGRRLGYRERKGCAPVVGVTGMARRFK